MGNILRGIPLRAYPDGHTLPGTSSFSGTRLLGAGVLVVITGFLVIAVTGLPEFGSIDNRHVAAFYIEHGLTLTGSPNIVNAILWDFRGYDTLGEETILFCAALSVFMIIRRKKYGRRD